MIQINLLDSAQIKGRRRASAAAGASIGGGGAGSALVAAAALGVLAVNGLLGWNCWSGISASRQSLNEIRAEHAAVTKEIERQTNEAEGVRKFREVVANQMDVLRSLDPPDRLLWSQKLNMLAHLTPSNVFLDEIKIEENVTEVETEQSKAAIAAWEKSTDKNKGPKPMPVRRPVIRYELFLTGLAAGQDHIEQRGNMMAFYRALTGYQTEVAEGVHHRFMDGFDTNFEFEEIRGEVYEGVPVLKFVFKVTTLPLGGEETQRSDSRKIASAAR